MATVVPGWPGPGGSRRRSKSRRTSPSSVSGCMTPDVETHLEPTGKFVRSEPDPAARPERHPDVPAVVPAPRPAPLGVDGFEPEPVPARPEPGEPGLGRHRVSLLQQFRVLAHLHEIAAVDGDLVDSAAPRGRSPRRWPGPATPGSRRRTPARPPPPPPPPHASRRNGRAAGRRRTRRRAVWAPPEAAGGSPPSLRRLRRTRSNSGRGSTASARRSRSARTSVSSVCSNSDSDPLIASSPCSDTVLFLL